MISDKAKIPIKTSNPVAAFKQLEGNSFRVHPAHQDEVTAHNAALIQEIESVLTRVEAPSARSTADDPSGKQSKQFEQLDQYDQTQQLLIHLKEKERLLTEQDVNYHVRIWNWQQEVARTQQKLDQRKVNLDQQEEQLRALQFELLQLQNQLIDSQLATREIVNDLNLPGQQEYALQSLKLEINQRFDHMLITWRAFASEIQELAEQISDQVEPL